MSVVSNETLTISKIPKITQDFSNLHGTPKYGRNSIRRTICSSLAHTRHRKLVVDWAFVEEGWALVVAYQGLGNSCNNTCKTGLIT